MFERFNDNINCSLFSFLIRMTIKAWITHHICWCSSALKTQTQCRPEALPHTLPWRRTLLYSAQQHRYLQCEQKGPGGEDTDKHVKLLFNILACKFTGTHWLQIVNSYRILNAIFVYNNYKIEYIFQRRLFGRFFDEENETYQISFHLWYVI